jgi:hypothetical protein
MHSVTIRNGVFITKEEGDIVSSPFSFCLEGIVSYFLFILPTTVRQRVGRGFVRTWPEISFIHCHESRPSP